MLNFCDFIQVYVFTTNHHLKIQGDMLNFCYFIRVCVFTTVTVIRGKYINLNKITKK